MAQKPQTRTDTVEVAYSNERWALLKNYRQKAQAVLEALQQRSVEAIVHGSVARGDVDKDSDVDAFIPNPPSSFQIETAIEQNKIQIAARTVIQATPTYAMKAYIEIDAATTITFPLMPLRKVEREFYSFSGEINLAQIREGTRVTGVDKRLMLIEPSEKGHIESSIVGKEEQAARRLKVSVQTIRDRVRTLTRRDTVGRTGVFIKRELASDETFEQVMKRLAEENPAVRRKLTSFDR